jgi:4'-phosphopantetheinyl transferase EntD
MTGPLFPAETQAINNARASRRAEFMTGRVLARAALRAVGASPEAIGTHDRAPVWPAGYCGSITHCPGYRAAAAASTDRVRAIGIDAETRLPLPVELVGEVLSGREVDLLARCAPQVSYASRIAFSAKESLYKLWSAVTGRWLGFGDAQVAHFHWHGIRGNVRLRITDPIPGFPTEVDVVGIASDSVVVTAAYRSS